MKGTSDGMGRRILVNKGWLIGAIFGGFMEGSGVAILAWENESLRGSFQKSGTWGMEKRLL